MLSNSNAANSMIAPNRNELRTASNATSSCASVPDRHHNVTRNPTLKTKVTAWPASPPIMAPTGAKPTPKLRVSRKSREMRLMATPK